MKFFILIFTCTLALETMAATPPHAESSPNPHTILAEVGKVVSPNGIDEAKAVDIGGIRQWITVRGRDRHNPILLVLHGGPAAPDLPNRYLFEGPSTDYFTVVEWDQRGCGKTYELNDPAKVAPTMDAERMLQDAEELVAYLHATCGKKKIFALGHSWGTILGLNLAVRRPDWLYAYIGVGQIINMREAERICYDWVLNTARKAGDTQAVKELEAIAPYPEPNGALPLEKINVERKCDFGQFFIIGTPNAGRLPEGRLFDVTFPGPAWTTGGELGTEASYFMIPAALGTFLYIIWFLRRRPPGLKA